MSLDARAISLAEGLRAGLAASLLMAAAGWFDWPPLLGATLGALITTLADPGGSLARRAVPMLSIGAAGFAFLAGFGAAPLPFPVTLALAAACLFATSYVRVWGPPAGIAGMLCAVVLCLALEEHGGTPGAALLRGTLFAAGSLWALLLTGVVWRLAPLAPARRALGDVWFRLAGLTADLRRLCLAAAITDEAWEAHARRHRAAVRTAIEQTRAILLDTLRARRTVADRATGLLLRLEAAERIFGALIALSELCEGEAALREAAEPLLRRLRPMLVVLSRAVVSQLAERLPRLDRSVSRALAETEATRALHALASVIAENLLVATRLTHPDEQAPAGPLPAQDGARLRRLLEPLRANWSFKSLSLRHALRLTLVTTAALAGTHHWSGPYQHWLSITIVVVMQPAVAATWTRAIERMAGTVLGALLAALLTFVAPTPLALAGLMIPLCVGAFALRQASYSAYIALYTPLVVLLVEAAVPGQQAGAIVAWRAGFTLAGGAIAIAASLLLWPSWEPDQLRRELLAALGAHANWARAALTPAADPRARNAARRAAGLATNNLEASLARALQEPSRGLAANLEAALVADAALRRIAGRLAALDPAPPAVDPSMGAIWRDWVAGRLDALARGASASPAPTGSAPTGPAPTGPAPETYARLARQIDLLAGAVGRFEATPSTAADPLEPNRAGASDGRQNTV